MKKIYVINKTHLDVGFTDLPKNVINRYMDVYIPNAIKLAEELGSVGEKFTWTTGSFLIKHFLDSQDDVNVKKMREAIDKGYIRWHAIPFTFHTELLSQELAEYMFSISKELDKEFGIRTTSAKMTDVPGHTKGLVKYLHKNSIKFIHFGVNGVSAVPDVPEIFVWRDGEYEVVVSYSDDYGGIIEVPFMEEKMAFMHTLDNSGPGTIETISEFMNDIRSKYPDYEVESTSMDEFSNILWEMREKLPVVTSEIGDTWIHGVMSDPELVRQYRNFTNYLKENNVPSTAMLNALLIPEHTWGLDIKWNLGDFLNFSKPDFQSARAKNDIMYSYLNGYEEIIGEHVRGLRDDFIIEGRSYQKVENSWKEKRDNILNVYEKLDFEAQDYLKNESQIPNLSISESNLEIGETININAYNVAVDGDGSLCLLEKNGKQYFNEKHKSGILNYSVCGIDDFDSIRNNYLRNNDWWRIDFFKPGMEMQVPPQLHINNTPTVRKISVIGNTLLIEVKLNQTLINDYGAPREILYRYNFEDKVTFEATLKNKDAIRMGEIISFNFNLNIATEHNLYMSKLGSKISPLDVVEKGNRIQHIVENINYNAYDKKIIINPVTSPLCGFGTYNNLSYKKDYKANVNDLYFTLLNTTWGTNFTMWYEEDLYAKFEFTLD